MPKSFPSRRSQRSTQVMVPILVLVLAAGGCRRIKSYVPPADSGRQALEAALTAWQNGHPVGKIENTSPPVQVVDSDWSKGQTLTNYEILEEVSRTDGRRCFKVRLNLQKPSATQEVQYLVVGRSPLWVFREEDYNGFANWGGRGK